MPLINPIYGLPNYSVERLSESEGKNRQRERKKNQKEEEAHSKKSPEQNEGSTLEEDLSSELADSSQPLDTETVVKLLDDQTKSKNSSENRSLKASTCYDHVKNLTDKLKVNREI